MKKLWLIAALLIAVPAAAQQQLLQNSYLPITGGLRTEGVPIAKFVDTFNSPSTLDTTNNWATPTQSGTGTATYTQGQEILSSGTTNGSYALLTSQAAFQINSPAFLIFRAAINFQVPESTANCKEMGLFIAAGTPTCAAPVTDGILFEVTAATTSGNPGGGKLQAVTYASGTRTLLADLSVPTNGISWSPIFNPDGVTLVCPGRTIPQPQTDTCPHILDIWFNGNSAEFDVDFKPVAFMLNGSQGPNNNALQWSAMTINTGGAAASTLKINQASVGDEGRNSNKFCDAAYPFRCLNVTANGALVPSVPLAPITGNATGTTGAVVGTLAAAAGKFTYICGFNVSSIGGTATVGPVTIAGLVGSSQIYQLPVNATAGQILVTQSFTPCIPSSAVNTAITVTTTADATATAVDVNSWGFQQ
jgi:hypothetical protein